MIEQHSCRVMFHQCRLWGDSEVDATVRDGALCVAALDFTTLDDGRRFITFPGFSVCLR